MGFRVQGAGFRVQGSGCGVWGEGSGCGVEDHLDRDGLVFKAHRLLYRSTLGLRVIKKMEEEDYLDLPNRAAKRFDVLVCECESVRV